VPCSGTPLLLLEVRPLPKKCESALRRRLYESCKTLYVSNLHWYAIPGSNPARIPASSAGAQLLRARLREALWARCDPTVSSHSVSGDVCVNSPVPFVGTLKGLQSASLIEMNEASNCAGRLGSSVRSAANPLARRSTSFSHDSAPWQTVA
jgi:hypothetical protein